MNKGLSCFVSDEDYRELSKYIWHVRATQKDPNKFYAATSNKQTNWVKARPYHLMMHRMVVGAKDGQEVDHINRDTLDNRRENLRIVTHEENCWNTGAYETNKLGQDFKNISQHTQPNGRIYYRVAVMRAGHRLRKCVGTLEEAFLVREQLLHATETEARKLLGLSC